MFITGRDIAGVQLGAVDKTRCGRDRECDWTRSVALFVTSSPRRVLDKRFPPALCLTRQGLNLLS